jgi:SOS response regulatory protein OraA/RecX
VIKIKYNEDKIYQNTIKYINKKIRTEYEIDKYLDKYNLSKEKKIIIIKQLKINNFINDNIYTKIYINNQIEFNLTSPNKLKSKLIKLGINKIIIDREINSIEDNTWIDIINKIIKDKDKNSYDSEYIFKNKTKYYLTMQGYNINLINKTLNSYYYDENHKFEIISNRYLNYYVKTKSNDEIDILRRKLLQRGFKLDIINNFINNICKVDIE